jgi:isopentenyl-diphosphate delta-isomerase
MVEYLDVVDENNELTGETVTMVEAHEKGIFHRTGHVWIMNLKGEILLQLRVKTKRTYPDLLDISAAGHIDAGETIEEGTKRELFEELGVKVEELPEAIVYKSMRTKPTFIENEFQYIYFLKLDLKIENLKLQKIEVEEVSFINLDEFMKDLKENSQKYVPHGDDYYNIVFENLERMKED